MRRKAEVRAELRGGRCGRDWSSPCLPHPGLVAQWERVVLGVVCTHLRRREMRVEFVRQKAQRPRLRE